MFFFSLLSFWHYFHNGEIYEELCAITAEPKCFFCNKIIVVCGITVNCNEWVVNDLIYLLWNMFDSVSYMFYRLNQ